MKKMNLETGTMVIAEIGLSHEGSLGLAEAYIDAVAEAGADAVKFQTHIADAESSEKEPWRVQFSKQDDRRIDYWRRTAFSEEQWLLLRKHAEKRGLFFLSLDGLQHDVRSSDVRWSFGCAWGYGRYATLTSPTC